MDGDVHPRVRRLVVVIHPTGQDAYESLMTARSAAAESGVEQETLILCPQFPQSHHNPAENQIDFYGMRGVVTHWGSGWRDGAYSSTSDTPWSERVSSFDVVDTMIEQLASWPQFPNLDSVVIAGHSAGGQFVDRYSKVSNVQDRTLDDAGISMRYLVCAPSSYAWLDAERPDPTNPGESGIPDASWNPECAANPDDFGRYDTWKHGTNPTDDHIYPNVDASTMRALLAQREVTYIVGGTDLGSSADYFVYTCEAGLQGADRIERMTNHFNHLERHDPDFRCTKSMYVVGTYGHEQIKNFHSGPGRACLFGPIGNSVQDDTLIFGAGEPGSVKVLANDHATGCRRWELAYYPSSSHGGGAISEVSPGALAYTPPYGYAGYDYFVYQAELDDGTLQHGRVHVYVLGPGTIQSMINDARSGDTIDVPPGLYFERIDLLGKEIHLRGTEGPEATIIDGLGLGSVVTCVSGETDQTIIEGFTIRGGEADQGGGAFIGRYLSIRGVPNVTTDSYPTFRNCVFTRNTARDGAAASVSGRRTPTFEGCSFTHNYASRYGGAIALLDCPIMCENSEFHNNIGRAGGGAIWSSSTSSMFRDTTFKFNSTLAEGGAGLLEGNGTSRLVSMPSFVTCTFEANTARRKGGALYLGNVAAGNIRDSSFRYNHSESGAAFFVQELSSTATYPSTIDLTDSVFCGNITDDHNTSAVIRDHGGNLFMEDCLDPITADFNGDYKVNGLDLATLLAAWGEQGSCDLDGDGDVDGADLAKLLAAWTG